jgi:PadR family transcriptional regulator PadR
VNRTKALVSVAVALMSDPGGRHHGYELSRTAGVRSAVMYRVLTRMLNEEWLTDGWEDQAVASREKRPPRRYYQVTDKGRAELGAVIAGPVP